MLPNMLVYVSSLGAVAFSVLALIWMLMPRYRRKDGLNLPPLFFVVLALCGVCGIVGVMTLPHLDYMVVYALAMSGCTTGLGLFGFFNSLGAQARARRRNHADF